MNRTALATMMVAFASTSYGRLEASKPPIERAVVTIRHIGEQDKPIWTLMIVSSARDLPPKTIHDFGLRFVVSRSVMSSLTDFVAGQAKNHDPDEPRLLPNGTFDVAWRASAGSGTYVVPSEEACPYLADVQRLAAEADPTSRLADAVRITRVRVGCGPLSP
jgi:hypothetical protein